MELKEDIAAAKSDTQGHGNFIFIIDAFLLFDAVLNCTSNNLTQVSFDYECTSSSIEYEFEFGIGLIES